MAPPKHSSPPRSRKADAHTPQPGPSNPAQAAIAAIPTVPLPPNTQDVPINYGTLNSEDPAFYLSATNATLHSILASVPADISHPVPSSATKDVLLNEIFRVRQEEALRTFIPSVPDKTALTTIMKMSPQELIALGQTQPDKLRSLMHSALVADSSLYPRNFSLSDNSELAATAVSWQLQAYKKAHGFQDSATPAKDDAPPQPQSVRFAEDKNNPTPTVPTVQQTLASLLDKDLNPRPSRASQLLPGDDSSEDSDAGERPSKKHKSDSVIQPVNFGYGAASAVKRLIRQPYPGKGYSPNNLKVQKLRGARILCNWISQGIDIPTFLFHFKWRSPPSNNPSQEEIEANTLGRIIHLEMLTYATPEQALQTRPSLEVALRRLHAIMYVEQSMADGTYTDKGLAWKHIEFFLETHPNTSVLCDEISEDIARRINIEKKHMTAVKTMEQNCAATRKRYINKQSSPGHTPPATPQKKVAFRR